MFTGVCVHQFCRTLIHPHRYGVTSVGTGLRVVHHLEHVARGARE